MKLSHYRMMRRRWPDQALRLGLAACVLALVVGLPLVIFGDVEKPVFQLTMVVLSMSAMTAGAFLGARSTS